MTHSMRIAVPITAPSVDGALRDIGLAAAKADVIELRIDYLQEQPCLERLLRCSPTPKIVTNRCKEEGGNFKGADEQRIAYLQQAIELGAEYVDIELRYISQLVKRPSTKLIVSRHLEDTPQLEGVTGLMEIHFRMVGAGADISKIVTTANCYDDNLRMLQFVSKASNFGYNVIGLCMGPKGKMSRVLTTVYGGYLTFASLEEGKSSASGQLTVYELTKAWKLLSIER